MTGPIEASLAWIRTALEEELPGAHPDVRRALAEQLHRTAADYSEPIENLVDWIHSTEFREALPDVWEEWQARCIQGRP